eukprot:200423-Ditylum_brightwellii.AAC.1
METEEWFPFLGMRMKWEKDELVFRVYKKENQWLKYVDKSSNHKQSPFKSITMGVLTSLERLTSREKELCDVGVNQIYLLAICPTYLPPQT